MSRKILVLEGANTEFINHVGNQIKSSKRDDVLIVKHDVKVYDIDGDVQVVGLQGAELDTYLASVGIKVE